MRRTAVRSAIGAAVLAATLLGSGPARADLDLCNRLSFVVEAAIGIEEKGATATRGWFRLDPGQCRTVLTGEVTAEQVFLHAKALPLYGPSPEPMSGHADLCVGTGDFVIAAARACRPPQRFARFAAVKPSEAAGRLVAALAEEAEYSDEQARRAGIQRLLVLAGYDAHPIDGVSGPKTDAAIAQFLKDRGLPADAATGAGVFDALMEAAQQPAASGFSWCNDTRFAVMAAIAVEEKGALVARGWYRVEPGKCVRPDVVGKPRRVFSYGEAVDGDGQPVRRGDRRLAWGGGTMLCTREARFELGDHKDCGAAGLDATGFAVVDLTGKPSATVRFQE
ncbi:hypothetical protein RHODGE_RHODGE_02227 [Rhodoplanes serenus]|uniref:Peptidoglycan binding-like domain-containing protein n=1 Tax=Rhodoplanes serenus TaxID=200615 RepID=A0A447CUY8_9BRAD|nr:DUF1036 domain-containing protein [Rhodoplanes serenus]VCU09054.1 hypothetical protein RHODGE_RHODGE_02227 [Rhodoplanes serenus]